MLKTSDLTRGERAFVYRRRLREPQSVIAMKIGVPLKAYRALERDDYDHIPDIYREQLMMYHRAIAEPLTDGEIAAVLRRRLKATLDEMAAYLGVSKQTLIRRERYEELNVAEYRRQVEEIYAQQKSQ